MGINTSGDLLKCKKNCEVSPTCPGSNSESKLPPAPKSANDKNIYENAMKMAPAFTHLLHHSTLNSSFAPKSLKESRSSVKQFGCESACLQTDIGTDRHTQTKPILLPQPLMREVKMSPILRAYFLSFQDPLLLWSEVTVQEGNEFPLKTVAPDQ